MIVIQMVLIVRLKEINQIIFAGLERLIKINLVRIVPQGLNLEVIVSI